MSDESKLNLLLQEFSSLKAEQLKRISARDHGVYLNVVAVGVVTALLIDSGHPATLIVIQWVSILLGWNHLMNDLKVWRIQVASA